MKSFLHPYFFFIGFAIALHTNASAATIQVTTNADSYDSNDGLTSLREAIGLANDTPEEDIISFAPSVTGEILVSGVIEKLFTNMVIEGPGADQLAIRYVNATSTVQRIFFLKFGAKVTIRGLTISNSDTQQYGGGILVEGSTLNLENCALVGIQGNGSPVSISGGKLNVRNCLFDSNTAINGGAIYGLNSTINVSNSTFYRNEATAAGGAIYNDDGILNVDNTTFAKNSAPSGGGIVNDKGAGTATFSMSHSILQHGTSGVNFLNLGGSLSPRGYNISSDSTGVSLSTDKANTHPLLGPLTDHGGPTQTLALLEGSPAIDGGDPAFDSSTLPSDQRGQPRVVAGKQSTTDAIIDIGAFELPPVPTFSREVVFLSSSSGPLDLETAVSPSPAGGTFAGTSVSNNAFDPSGLSFGNYTITYTVTDEFGVSNSATFLVLLQETIGLEVTTTADTFDGSDGKTSLREAIYLAESDGEDSIITFAASLFATPQTITLSGSELTIDSDEKLTINGPGAHLLTVSGNDQSRIFSINSNIAEVTINGVTMSDGNALPDEPFQLGGGIFNRGILVISNSTVKNNRANYGGGIYAGEGGTIALTNATVSGNEAETTGGGIYLSTGEMGIANSTLKDNRAGALGGAIYHYLSDLTITGSTISGNEASTEAGYGGTGGGIYNSKGTASVISSTISNNRAARSGAGITNASVYGGQFAMTLSNSTISGNTVTAPEANPPVCGIYNIGTLAIRHTILDHDAGTPNVASIGTLTSLGYNISSDSTGPDDGSTDLLNTAPLLGPLTDNGGPIETHALLSGSPAIDAGDPNFDPNSFSPSLVNDQRGLPRLLRGKQESALAIVDVGAYERLAIPDLTPSSTRFSSLAGPVDLAELTGAHPAGGVFSGPGVENGTLDPSTTGAGMQQIGYTVSDSYGITSQSSFSIEIFIGVMRPDLRIGKSGNPDNHRGNDDYGIGQKLFLKSKRAKGRFFVSVENDGNDVDHINTSVRGISKRSFRVKILEQNGAGNVTALLVRSGYSKELQSEAIAAFQISVRKKSRKRPARFKSRWNSSSETVAGTVDYGKTQISFLR